MVAPNLQRKIQVKPLKIVGGNNFGRYNKISREETFNMIISPNDSQSALVDYAGYKNVLTILQNQIGKDCYVSQKGNFIIAIWGVEVYTITISQVFPLPPVFTPTFIGNIQSNSGEVYISENNNGQIAITDGSKMYVYNYVAPTSPLLLQSGVDFTVPFNSPGYISFQNGRLIVVDNGTTNWYLSAINDAISWSFNANSVGALQTKTDTVQAVVPVPSGGNNILVFGKTVIEQWQDIGTALFPYQKSSTSNVDFGTLNAASIASLDNFIVFLAGNEQSGLTLMVYSNGSSKSISTEGIDFKLSKLKNPSNCNGFLARIDGHVIYQFSFLDDNLSYIYDFTTGQFFTVTDENLNFHIAKNVVFFDNKYYFVSMKGGNLYEFGTQYTNYQYSDTNIQQIPRIRVCPPERELGDRYFIIKSIGITVENGQENIQYTNNNNAFYSEAIDLSTSRDGGETFGNSVRIPMNPTGKRRSRINWPSIGGANDFTAQFKFNGFNRFVVFDGYMEVYQ